MSERVLFYLRAKRRLFRGARARMPFFDALAGIFVESSEQRARKAPVEIDRAAIQEFLLTLLPLAATFLAVAIGLGLANYFLITRSRAAEPDGRVVRLPRGRG